MRLSHGFVRGEALSCIYHGWSYGAGGNCLRIPAHPSLEPPEAIHVPVYAACDAGHVIWVAATKPDTAPPDLSGLEPLRSMTVEADLTALAGLTAQADGTLRGRIDGVMVAVALQTAAPRKTVLHVLAEPAAPDARVALSRWLEVQRRLAEQVAA
jgi:hypothetical protein